MKTVKNKLLLLILPIVTFSLFFVAYFNFYKAEQFVSHEFEEKAQAELAGLQNTVSLWMEEHTRIIQVMSGETWNLQYPEKEIPHLNKIQKLYPEFEMMFVTDAQGTAYTTTNHQLVLEDRDYFQQAMKGDIVVSNVTISRDSNNKVIVVIAPIYQGNQVIGTVGGVLNTTGISKIVSETELGKTGYGYMIQNNGVIVAHPDQELILQKNLLEEENPELQTIIQDVIDGKSGQGEYNFESIDKLVFYVPITQVDWGLILTVPMKEVTEDVVLLKKMSFTMVVLAVIVVYLLIIFFISRFVRPIKQLADLTSQVADGDFSVRSTVDTKDELGRLSKSFNIMLQSVGEMIQENKVISEELAESSLQLSINANETGLVAIEVANSIHEVAVGTIKQAESVGEVMVLLKETKKLVKQGKEQSEQTFTKAISSSMNAENGEVAIVEAITHLETVTTAVTFATDAIQQLGKRSNEINEIIGVITDISAQTNLLALNAAIEASRAGEQGLGFAVVASEVRKLAEKSRYSAEQITHVIHDIQIETAATIRTMESNVDAINRQATMIQVGGEALTQIVDTAKRTEKDAEFTHMILHSIDQTTDRLYQLTETVTGLIEMTSSESEHVAAAAQEQSATVEEVSAMLHKLSGISEILREEVSKFKV